MQSQGAITTDGCSHKVFDDEELYNIIEEHLLGGTPVGRAQQLVFLSDLLVVVARAIDGLFLDVILGIATKDTFVDPHFHRVPVATMVSADVNLRVAWAGLLVADEKEPVLFQWVEIQHLRCLATRRQRDLDTAPVFTVILSDENLILHQRVGARVFKLVQNDRVGLAIIFKDTRPVRTVFLRLPNFSVTQAHQDCRRLSKVQELVYFSSKNSLKALDAVFRRLRNVVGGYMRGFVGRKDVFTARSIDRIAQHLARADFACVARDQAIATGCWVYVVLTLAKAVGDDIRSNALALAIVAANKVVVALIVVFSAGAVLHFRNGILKIAADITVAIGLATVEHLFVAKQAVRAVSQVSRVPFLEVTLLVIILDQLALTCMHLSKVEVDGLDMGI